MIDSRNIFGGASSMSATKRLYNLFNVAGWSARNNVFPSEVAISAVSGALTANTLVDLINESGSAGEISHLALKTNDATARTIRVVVTIDGTVIFDRTSASVSTTDSGIALAGQINSGLSIALPPIKYTNSKRIQYASNQNETGKFTTYLAFQDVT
jgi:hypothetical protein